MNANDRQELWSKIDDSKQRLIELSDRVWGMPEVCYTEVRSAAEHKAELLHQGFRVKEGLAGIPTSLVGELGEAAPSLHSSENTMRCQVSARRRVLPNTSLSRRVVTVMVAAITCSAPAPCWRLSGWRTS